MIIRQSILRQGRRVVTRPARSWTRALASEVDSIESSVHNSLKKIHSIESLIQNETSTPIAPIDDETGAAVDFESDEVTRNYQALKRQQRSTGHLGTSLTPHYQPYKLLADPPSPSSITLELLLASQSHLGHSTSLWNPMNSRYIFGIREGIHIISLDVTAAHLRRACRIVTGVTQRGGLILFVGTRPGQERCVVNAAKLAGGCHLFERWVPGSITNGQQILGGCKLKVVDQFDREVQGHDANLRERAVLKPDLIVCLNPLENWVMLHECSLNNIPTIGIIDTDADPTWVTYPIPANDDSLRCVQVIAGALGKAGEEGQNWRRNEARKGNATYEPSEFEEEEESVATSSGRSIK